MVKCYPKKNKDSKRELAIAIRKNFEAGMKPRDISKLFNITKQRVNYCIHHSTNNKRRRRSRLSRNEKNILIKWDKDKPLNLASAKRLRNRFNSLPKYKKGKKKQKKISLSTVNKVLNRYLSKPKQIKKVFFLSTLNKEKRLEFLKFMKKNRISPQNIFFTDESSFNISSFFNKNNKIRLSNKTSRAIKRGNEIALRKVTKQFHKKLNGILVSGGICNEGLGKIIFHRGTVNSLAYKQVLNFYKEDIGNFTEKYFQQDGARAHSSKSSQTEIKRLFGEKYIPTWEKGPLINGEKMPKWPPNSPDLSPIELVWSIVKGMLNIFQPSNIEELKFSINKVWNSIASNKKICENIIKHMEKRWDLCIQHKGRRLDKQLLRRIAQEEEKTNLSITKSEIKGTRISYNDKILVKLKNKEIKEKKRQLKELLVIENKLKNDFDKLMKLCPKEYKNISDKEKKELKFNYEHEKARRELMDEEIKKINDMSPIEYLNLLNEDTKEKLIGLCLNRKPLEAYENDSLLDEDTREEKDDVDYSEEEDESEELSEII